MTIVSLDKTTIKKGYQTLSVSGHADAERVNDYDLVCCSCSMLLYTLIDSLDKHELLLNAEEIEKAIDDSLEFGKVPNIDIKMVWNRKADAILDTVLNGFYLLQKNYKKNVKVLSYF